VIESKDERYLNDQSDFGPLSKAMVFNSAEEAREFWSKTRGYNSNYLVKKALPILCDDAEKIARIIARKLKDELDKWLNKDGV
jgi:hypothetical protein